ncbi:hypothetical protein [Candidatus Endomicrobiellum trichonymphae]|uniref:hypothetical protein n=1 Tax=Endomicrobium trichonymphae TaxID=1408204 RepID=UPI000320A5B8|nr:hypothetical protein [Candidatus Endomicrobium trichonymphae]
MDCKALENCRQCKNYDSEQGLCKLNLYYVYGEESVDMCAYLAERTKTDKD